MAQHPGVVNIDLHPGMSKAAQCHSHRVKLLPPLSQEDLTIGAVEMPLSHGGRAFAAALLLGHRIMSQLIHSQGDEVSEAAPVLAHRVMKTLPTVHPAGVEVVDEEVADQTILPAFLVHSARLNLDTDVFHYSESCSELCLLANVLRYAVDKGSSIKHCFWSI